jgi:hypothetical protein
MRFAAAFGAMLSGCSGDAPHEVVATDDEASRLAASADGVVSLSPAAPGDGAATDFTSPEMLGGQSGGEGGGYVPDIEEGPPQPCACMNAASVGKVLSLGDGCAQVQVIETFDRYRKFEVGDVIGGILDVACRGSDPIAVGDDVLFQYYPGPSDECPAVRQCYEADCVWRGVEDACRQACRDSSAETCASVGPLAWSLQTGRFSALKAQAGSVSFYFAGEEREASVAELTVPMCQTEHFALLDAYGRVRDPRLENIEDASYDPISCFRAP